MKNKLELFIENKHSELKKVMSDTKISNFLEKNELDEIYDDRFLIKPVKSAKKLMPNAFFEIPYAGAKEMLLVDDVENKEFLAELFEAMYEELPASKIKKKK